MAIQVSFYRDADGSDCTNGGVSSRAKSAILLGVEGPYKDDGDFGADIVLVLVKRNIGGDYFHVEPQGSRGHAMFGGNFVFTSDSRLRAICPYPIPVHDRFE